VIVSKTVNPGNVPDRKNIEAVPDETGRRQGEHPAGNESFYTIVVDARTD
jgi:hypothetical protein